MTNTEQDLPPIDFARYPLDHEGSEAWDAVIARARDHLDTHQYCSLPGFFVSDALPAIAEEAGRLMTQAHRAESFRNCYLMRDPDPTKPDDHPANLHNRAVNRMIAADRFPESSPLKRLYYFEPFRRLIAAIVGLPALYPSEDALQPVNVICHAPGDESGWHFDSDNAFTMTLMLQKPEAGGEFELAPNTRDGEENEDVAYMTEVLTGGRDRVVKVSRAPGELTIFRGCNSLHRVSRVEGTRPRLMCVMVYENRPGVIGDPEVNLTVYGRTGREAA